VERLAGEGRLHRGELRNDGPQYRATGKGAAWPRLDHALTAAKKQRPEVILLDIGLPDRKGTEVPRATAHVATRRADRDRDSERRLGLGAPRFDTRCV
jgi:DNA-binding response OmpR family regulator